MYKKGTIIVIPKSGLSNRLRVMATSIKLARETNKELYIYWDSNQYLNAAYKDLFKIPTGIFIGEPPVKYKLWLMIKSISPKLNPIAKFYLKFFNFDFKFFDNMAPLIWHNKLDLEKEVCRSKKVFMATCQELNYCDLEDYKLFVPTAELQNEIDAEIQRFSKNTIGIHIRSTDNEEAKKKSPFPIFSDKIEEEIKLNNKATFFISTDNEEYQKNLLEKFGDTRIFFHKKEFRRDVAKGVKDAVIDIFCLSKTAKIYGSYFSSFSYVAGRIGDVEVDVLKK